MAEKLHQFRIFSNEIKNSGVFEITDDEFDILLWKNKMDDTECTRNSKNFDIIFKKSIIYGFVGSLIMNTILVFWNIE